LTKTSTSFLLFFFVLFDFLNNFFYDLVDRQKWQKLLKIHIHKLRCRCLNLGHGVRFSNFLITCMLFVLCKTVGHCIIYAWVGYEPRISHLFTLKCEILVIRLFDNFFLNGINLKTYNTNFSDCLLKLMETTYDVSLFMCRLAGHIY